MLDPSDSTQKFEVTIRQVRKDSLLADFLHPGQGVARQERPSWDGDGQSTPRDPSPGLTVHPGCPPPVYSECDSRESTCNDSSRKNSKKSK